MLPKSIFTENIIKSITCFSILLVAILLVPISLNGTEGRNASDSPSISSASSGENFDILDFWDKEIERVNSTLLNIVYGSNRTIQHTIRYSNENYELNVQDVYFNSPNWVGAQPQVLRIYGVLLYPENMKSSNPGALAMHGLNGKVEDAFDLAITYLEKGFVVLCHSHPGHGYSEGAEPQPSNLYFEGEYNESAHFYLTLCGAIQGLRVLESLPFVNNSQIMVTGKSYGGSNAMWLAGIAGERIAGVSVYIAIGDIVKNLRYPKQLIFWVLGKNVREIPDSYLTNQLLRFDPIYYLKSPDLPPILWQIGTNDDFFHYSSIKGTYDAVQHSDKFLQIFPNGHHGFPGFEGSSSFFIDYIINNGRTPPRINITNVYKTQDSRGDNLRVVVQVNSIEEIGSVQLIYRYTDILGTCWERVNLKNTNGAYWEGEINPTIYSSKFDYYIIVKLKNANDTWFSSEIFSAGMMRSNLTVPFITIISLIICTFFILAIRRKVLKLNKLRLGDISKEKHKLFKEISMIIVIDTIYWISIVLPWVVYENGEVIFDHIYFFNNFYTWKLNVGEIAPFLTTIFFLATLANSLLNFASLRLSAFLKLLYPTVILTVIIITPFISGAFNPNSLASNFGVPLPGIGPILMIICAISLFFIGRWEFRNKKSLGLVKKKIFKRLDLKEKFRKKLKAMK